MHIVARYKNFSVSDLFIPARGKSLYTRAYAERNSGIYPVYSASLTAPLCHIDTYDFDGTYLTWTTNGYGGRIQVISGKFSINGDRGLFVPLGDLTPNLDYIKYVLEPVLIDQAVGRIVDGKKNEYTKVSPEVASESVISLPVDNDGNLDLIKMRDAAKKILHVESLQNTLQKYQDEITTTEVLIECEDPFTTLSLGNEKYFSLSIGERVLKKHSREHGVPVYSANVSMPFAHIAVSNLFSFEQDSLIWGIDGVFDWNRIPSGVEFATTDHCGRLQIKSKALDPEYIFYALRATRLEYGFDRVFRANLENVGRLICVRVPVDKNGQFSLSRQKKMAKRYRELNDLKSNTCQVLDSLYKVKIDIAA